MTGLKRIEKGAYLNYLWSGSGANKVAVVCFFLEGASRSVSNMFLEGQKHVQSDHVGGSECLANK